MAYQILGGEGYCILKAYLDNVLVQTINMPYCEQGGFTERWEEVSLLMRTQSIDYLAPQAQEDNL